MDHPQSSSDEGANRSPGKEGRQGPVVRERERSGARLVGRVGHRRHVRAPRQVGQRRRRLELERGEFPDVSATDAPAADPPPPSSETMTGERIIRRITTHQFHSGVYFKGAKVIFPSHYLKLFVRH